ncbi:MAG: DNA topoisomerase [Thermoproteota archaeon]
MVIFVESVKKAQTLSSFLPSSWTVIPTYGHFMYYTGRVFRSSPEIECEWRVRAGYGQIRDQIASYKTKRDIIVASDPDAEGELIAYHISRTLGDKNVRRIKLHAVTPSEFKRALEKSAEISMAMVRSAIVRTVCDYHIGMVLSRKVGSSAGRLQVAMMHLINQKEAEKHGLMCRGFAFAKARNLLQTDVKYKLSYLSKERRILQAPAPLITGTAMFAAHKIFGISPMKTANVLQDLYTSGKITYPRTDCKWISPEGLQMAKDFIQQISEDLIDSRQFDVPGHHECIRPTTAPSPFQVSSQDNAEKIVYGFISSFFFASQCRPAQGNMYKGISGEDLEIEFFLPENKGFLKIFETFNLPYPLNNVSYYVPEFIVPLRITGGNDPDIHHSMGSLILEMSEKGIGRPSTFAYGLDRLIENGYVSFKSTRSPLILTDLGKSVMERSIEMYPFLGSESWQSELEKLFKEIAFMDDENSRRSSIKVYEQICDLMDSSSGNSRSIKYNNENRLEETCQPTKLEEDLTITPTANSTIAR